MTRRPRCAWVSGVVGGCILCLLLSSCTSSGRTSTDGPVGPITSATAPALGGTATSATPVSPGTAGSSLSTHRPVGEQQLAMSIKGTTRTALIERPVANPRNQPLVVVLPGARGSGSTTRDQLQFDSAAKQAGVIVVYAEGDPETRSWRVGCCQGYAVSSDDDFAFISALIRSMEADGEVDPRHVVVLGFSVGAYFANSIACRYPDLVSGVVSVAGELQLPPASVRITGPPPTTLPRCTPARPVTVLELHGGADGTVPIAGRGVCSVTECQPQVRTTTPSAAVVDAWWRALDRCGAPTRRASNGASVSLASCAGGTHVGLAVVPGVGHSLADLADRFPLAATLIALAHGMTPAAW